jgi:hypothetical protein
MVKGWKKRYFELSDDLLIYYDKKGGKVKGNIHLKISEIKQVADDELRINVRYLFLLKKPPPSPSPYN